MSPNHPNPPEAPPARDWHAEPFGHFPDEVDEDAVLRQATEILQRRAEAVPEPEPVPPSSIPEGGQIVIHVLTTFSRDGYRKDWHNRGQEVVVRAEDVTTREWTSGDGENGFDRLLRERRTIAPGPWPSWMRVWTYGDARWDAERRAAVARGMHPAEVEREFGPRRFTPETAEAFWSARHREREAWEAAHGKEVAP